MNNKDFEQTLVLIKPDALKNSLTGYVLSQLSEFHTGLHFAGAKIVSVTRMLAMEHYTEHKGKPFFNAIVDYLIGLAHYPNDPWKRRVIAFVYQGRDAVAKIRAIAGPTNPNEAREEKPGSIRALGTVVSIKDKDGNLIGERLDNLIHASSTSQDAEREIKLWFKPNDIPPVMCPYKTEISEEHYYYKDGRLLTKQETGSTCLLAPGDYAWKTDLEALRAIHKNSKASCSLEAVAAKYLINARSEYN